MHLVLKTRMRSEVILLERNIIECRNISISATLSTLSPGYRALGGESSIQEVVSNEDQSPHAVLYLLAKLRHLTGNTTTTSVAPSTITAK